MGNIDSVAALILNYLRDLELNQEEKNILHKTIDSGIKNEDATT